LENPRSEKEKSFESTRIPGTFRIEVVECSLGFGTISATSGVHSKLGKCNID
jgi:hypothetical protein